MGVEEPIRWTLGRQRQDRAYDEPMHIEEEEPPHQDVFWHRFVAYGEQPLADGRGP